MRYPKLLHVSSLRVACFELPIDCLKLRQTKRDFLFPRVSRISHQAISGDSVEQNIKALVQQSPKSSELDHLAEFGFFVTECVPLWQICIAETLAGLQGRVYDKVFRKLGSKKKPKRWDDFRKISYIVPDDVLYKLVTDPVKRMMKRLGLLDVVGKDVKRVVGGCAALKSLKMRWKMLKAALQGMHTDTPPYADYADWGDDVTFSTITAGSKPCALEIYPMSWNGGRGPVKKPVRITIPAGSTIVFHGVARHRGVSYETDVLRFFISFVVQAAAERAEETTSVVERWDHPEGSAISFDDWKAECLRLLS